MIKTLFYNDDCINSFEKINDNSIDLVITDVPYGVNFKNDFYDDSKEYVFNNLASVKCQRNYIGIEQDEYYFNVAKQMILHEIGCDKNE